MLQINELYKLHILKFIHGYNDGDLASPLLSPFTRNTETHGYETRQQNNPRKV